eukprot:COSAG01_NODE_11729_length_1871_cov_1.196953_2_plen_245_part_00
MPPRVPSCRRHVRGLLGCAHGHRWAGSQQQRHHHLLLARGLATSSAVPPRVGLVGGLGLHAGIYYYREIAAACLDAGRPLELALVHCQISAVLEMVAADDRHGLADYLADVIRQLEAAGATFAVVPAVAPHRCIDELAQLSPLPLVDMLGVIRAEVDARQLGRVAIFGTRAVQESACYGRLSGVTDVVTPPPELVTRIDHLYGEVARGVGAAASQRAQQRAELTALAEQFIAREQVGDSIWRYT